MSKGTDLSRTLLYMIRERPDAVGTIQDVFRVDQQEAEGLLEAARGAFKNQAYLRRFFPESGLDT